MELDKNLFALAVLTANGIISKKVEYAEHLQSQQANHKKLVRISYSHLRSLKAQMEEELNNGTSINWDYM